MACKLAVRYGRGYAEVRVASSGKPLRISGSVENVECYGSITHEFEVDIKSPSKDSMSTLEFMRHYYELAEAKGDREGADYAVVEKGLEGRIGISSKRIRLISTLTLLLKK